MKVYLEEHSDNLDVPLNHREKISLLKIAEENVLVKDIGMRDGKYFLIIENDVDVEFLKMKFHIDRKKAVLDVGVQKLTQFYFIDTYIQQQKDML